MSHSPSTLRVQGAALVLLSRQPNSGSACVSINLSARARLAIFICLVLFTYPLPTAIFGSSLAAAPA